MPMFIKQTAINISEMATLFIADLLR